jgi:quercetin dioxygenase-like cupin family protein
MSGEHVFKNIDMGKTLKLRDLVIYQEGQVVSRTLVQKDGTSVTAFAFPMGEGLSRHTASGDALVQILEGVAAITIGDTAHEVKAGESIVMPAGIPHALDAPERFKMLLTVVKP